MMKNGKGFMLALLLVACMILSGCGVMRAEGDLSMSRLNGRLKPVYVDDDFRVTYEVFVYSFFDSDGDGIGDLRGLDEQLDYIGSGDLSDHESLGCTEIWPLPVFPSP
ncbi:MAG: alpha-amylase family glycosyl hydrolase, partial [Lachnospiraceae bacterium]